MNENSSVSSIGVDDWAFRKGINYGSVIVDLDTNRIIDLLGDREHNSFKLWLDKHKNVKVVSRDRSTEYSSAIKSTGRNICEVADLFHLVKNMSDCIKKVISDNYHEYRELVSPKITPDETLKNIGKHSVPDKQDSRLITYNEVKRLQAEGMKPYWIARHLKISRPTATKFCKMDKLPPRKTKERNEYYKYDAYVEQEYNNGKAFRIIYEEIKKQGFKGSLTPFYAHYRYISDGHRGFRSKKQMERIRRRTKKNLLTKSTVSILPIKTLSAIVDRKMKKLYNGNSTEESLVNKLMSLDWFNETLGAATGFYEALHSRNACNLESWIKSYEKSSVSKIRSFVLGIKLDMLAVSKAITTNIRNGIVEGFVNKIKVQKRIMYGKAKLELLRRKLIVEYTLFN